MSTQQLYCYSHQKQKTFICLTDNCNTMHCQDCSITHRKHHNGELNIMQFSDVHSFSVQSQKLFSDSLRGLIDNMSEQCFNEEVRLKIEILNNQKLTLRKLTQDFFEELAKQYHSMLSHQQEDYLKGLRCLKTQIQSHFHKSQNHLSQLQEDSNTFNEFSNIQLTPPTDRSSLIGGVFTSKFKLSSSQNKKDIIQDDVLDYDSTHNLNHNDDINITPNMIQSVIETLHEQQLMKSQMKTYNQEHQNLLLEFHKNKLIVNQDMQENFKALLNNSFQIGTGVKKQNMTSLSPINFVAQSQGRNQNHNLMDNSISTISEQHRPIIVQVPMQLKNHLQRPLKLSDLEVDTHDYFSRQPFFHFFNTQDNQIVIQHLGAPDKQQARDHSINRARFQSTYNIDPTSIMQQQTKKKELSKEIFRNIFQGGIEKKTLNSTFAIPSDHRTIALPNRDVYLVGGSYDSETVPFVFKYNWDSNQLVEAGKPLNISRSNFGIAQLNNYIYVVGGLNDKLGTLKSCEKMDVVTKQWSPIADLNVGCRDLSVCSFSNRLLFKFGGVGSDDQLNEYIEKYDPDTNRWISFHIENKSSLRSKFQLYARSGSVQINSSHIMVFGGSDAGLQEDTDQTFLCEIGSEYCRVVALNKVTISTKGAILTNPVVQNNRIYAMQLQRDKKGNLHPFKRSMMLYEDKVWRVNH